MARAGGGRSSRRAIIVVTLLIVFIGSNFSAYFYTDLLWFKEVGFTSVLWTSLGTQWGVGLATGVVVAALVWINLVVAARLAPAYRAGISIAGGSDPLQKYREAAAPYFRRLRFGAAAVVGFLIGAVASSNWETFLLYANRVEFGSVDPQFGRDISFYVFELPLYDLLVSEVWTTLFACLLITVGAHLLYGSIRAVRGLGGVAPGALAHVSVILGLLALTKSAQYWLGRFQLNFSSRGVVDGASYTDVHAQLPALNVLALISIVSAVLFLVNIRLRRVSLPLAAVGIWILFSFVAGGIWPWSVQRFSVEPNELPRERPFLQRNIEATRGAFQLDDVETRPFAASFDLTPEDLKQNQPLLRNVRVWDPGILQLAYIQLQAIRPYYEFPDVDIDRYRVNGQLRQVLLSARELSIEHLEDRSKKWANEHLQYTHGYGLVASLANEATTAGQPDFLVQGVPGTVEEGAESLAVEQARVYFGEAFEDREYSIVNTNQQEIDYPTDAGPERSRYEGEGGVPVGTFGKKLAFAIREGDTNLILSDLITPESKIIFYRNVRDRVLRAAPFMQLDGDPYVANVDGRLTWILDGYTSTPWYPYSERFDVGAILNSSFTGQPTGNVNYIRNSVKITVDAYDGTMKFYVIDDEDPLVAAWRNAFPELFTDEEPSMELREHFRYPEDLFKIQSEVYTTYHIEDPNDYYSREDVWAIPFADQPVQETTALSSSVQSGLVPPTYLLIELPQEEGEEFVLARPFTPRTKANMISFMVARADPDHYGELVSLQFPRQKLIPGPAQVHNLINQDVEFSQTRTLLGREGSAVQFGSLITLPIEESILYVQPVFVISEGIGIPELKRVLLVFGEEVAVGETFEEALADLFGDDVDVPEEPDLVEGDGDEEPEPDEGDEPRPGDSELQQILTQAARLYEQAQEALAAGDFEEYGRLIEQLGELLEQANP
ncbi:MAG TPA: UPF0182 family protein [Actinomycetota bacterium]|nr:UPF0182 family protein [Actinomycetota bacterium]